MTRELQEKLESYQRVWAEVDLDAIWENMVHKIGRASCRERV